MLNYVRNYFSKLYVTVKNIITYYNNPIFPKLNVQRNTPKNVGKCCFIYVVW